MSGSKSELERALIQLFQQYDTDNDGHLDAQELMVMIRGIEQTVQLSGNANQQIIAETAALIHGQTITMTEEDVEFILTNMDTDNNGTLELPEWIAWLRAGLSRTDAQLNAIPAERQGVVRFIRSIRKYFTLQLGTKNSSTIFFAKNPFEKSLYQMFQKYDEQTGRLNTARLLLLMTQVSRTCNGTSGVSGVVVVDPTLDDAAFVIRTIDLDGDNEVDVSEFIAWIVAGASKTNAEMKMLAAKSPLHGRLLSFIRNVQKVCTRREDFLEQDKGEEGGGVVDYSVRRISSRSEGGPLKVRLSQVFTDYDMDGDGHIDAYEMLAVRFFVFSLFFWCFLMFFNFF